MFVVAKFSLQCDWNSKMDQQTALELEQDKLIFFNLTKLRAFQSHVLIIHFVYCVINKLCFFSSEVNLILNNKKVAFILELQ